MATALTRDVQPHHRDRAHPLDELGPDHSGWPPLCGAPEFSALVESMVANEAPRLFAVAQEYGDRFDARIAAWGMAFADHAEVVSVERTGRMSLQAPEHALRLLGLGSHVRARLMWLNPNAATPRG